MHIPQAIVPLALSAYTAVTRTFDAATVQHTAPVKALAETTVDIFNDNGCGQYVTTIFVPNNGKNGPCNAVDGNKSMRMTGLEGGCSITGYTDGSCSENAFSMGQGSCIINTFSFSVDC